MEVVSCSRKSIPKVKEASCVIELLIHFDLNLPLVLACDASQYGIGAVLVHRLPDGSERLTDNGIHHLTTAPYHPASNGLVERAVQVVKKGLKKNKKGSFCTRLSRTLFSYRITPQIITSVSPAELLLKRRPRSKLDLLRLHLADRVERKQQSQKEQHDSHSKEREFHNGAKVWIYNKQKGDKWLPGTILSKEGSVTYHVEMQDGRVCKCHTDQLRLRTIQADVSDSLNLPNTPLTLSTPLITPSSNVSDSPPSEPSNANDCLPTESDLLSTTEQLPVPSTEQLNNVEPPVVQSNNGTDQRRSSRARQPVDRYEPKW